MKNRYIFWFLVLVAAASAVYFFKDELFSMQDASSWDFVPESAGLVWEFDDPIKDWNEFLQTDHWKNAGTLPFLKGTNSTLNLIDSLMGRNGLLDELLKSGNFLISMHTISSTSFDFIFIVKIEQPEFQEHFIRINDHFAKHGNFNFVERNYHGKVIKEIQNATDKETFSYILVENHFIGSFTPFLVEDVIRTIQGESKNFKTTNSDAFELAYLEFDAGNIYLDLEKLSTFMSLFVHDRQSPLIRYMNSFNGSGFLDVDFEQDYIYANGFFIPENDSSYLSVFRDLKPVSSNYSQFVPENTALVFYQSFDNAILWHNGIREFWRKSQWTQTDSLTKFINTFEFDLDRTLNWMSSHLIQIYLEPTNNHSSRLLLMETVDVHDALNQLNKLSEKANIRLGDTLYFENYDDLTINLLNISEFPSKLFGDWYRGYPQTYYTFIENYIVISEDIESIKALVNSREDEFTWKQSIAKSEFLNHNLDESNIGLFVNTPKAWNVIGAGLSEYWHTSWNAYHRSLKQNELVGLQMSHSGSGSKFYSSLVIKQRKAIQFRPSNANRTRRDLAVLLDTTITHQPKVVRNHLNGNLEVLIQDSANQLYLVDGSGNILWKDSLEGKIRGQVYQIDFYKNNKLQYLLATDSNLHIIDRNSENVDDYPISISDMSVDHLLVIDYDRSRNYRFMVTNFSGNAYLLDKEGNRLKGWDPKIFGSRFSVPPFHLRVRSRDVFVAISERGVAIATNRRGETIPGFPLDLDTGIGGDIFYQLQAGFDKTILTIVSDEGEIIKFNLEGNIVSRQQLYKPARDTKFWMVKENLGRSFVIARQDLNRLAIVDAYDKVMMEKDYFSAEEISVQYYNFGAGKELIIVINAEPGEALIYDGTGNLKSVGIKSTFPVSVLYYESKEMFNIYTALGDSLFVYSVPE